MGAYFPPPSYFLNVVELDSMKLIEKRPFVSKNAKTMQKHRGNMGGEGAGTVLMIFFQLLF